MPTYNKDSIQKLDPLSFTRLRPDTYCGSTADSTQLVTEIVSNAVDEHLIGNCDKVCVSIDKEHNVVTVSDNGQGIIPNNKQPDGKTTLEMVYGDINSSGKFDKSDNAVYKVSTGAFGIGAALTNYLSHWLIARTYRGGTMEEVSFKEGIFEQRKIEKCDKNKHGVEVIFNPSEEFFTDARPNESSLLMAANNITCVCPHLTYEFNGKIIRHPKGLNDFLTTALNKVPELTTERVLFKKANNRQLLDFGLTISTESAGKTIGFCNYAPIEAGTPITAIKGCITRTFNKWAHEQKILKDKDSLTGNAIQENMIVIFNLVSPNIRYDSQTKVRVTSTEDNEFINEVLSSQLEVWLDSNPADGRAILEKALLARKAAEAAKKAREAVKKKAEKQDKVFKLPTTLVDAWSKDRSKCELMICEGKSAASGLVAGRDAEFQAVYGVRGMMVSARKTTLKRFLQNQEVNNLILALGLDLNPMTGKLTYDKKKLRYDKIIGCADADPAGYFIELLLFNILWFMCPELIINGHVYSAEPPLFRVTTKDNQYIYLKDESALQQYKENNSSKIKFIGRNKGLGESDSDELAYSLLDPKTRTLVQLQVEDFDKTENLFELMFGKEVSPRVKYILKHSEEVDFDCE